MKEQPKHTPGPWSVCAPLPARYGASAIVYHELENGENVEIATIQEPLGAIKASVRWLGLSMANANLIAAAPELLAALEAIVGPPDGPWAFRVDSETIALARSAIAKAKGGTA